MKEDDQPVCGDCLHIDMKDKVDSRSKLFKMDLFNCRKTAQYVSAKRVICGDFT